MQKYDSRLSILTQNNSYQSSIRCISIKQTVVLLATNSKQGVIESRGCNVHYVTIIGINTVLQDENHLKQA